MTTGFVSTVGPFVRRFEEMVANAVGATQAVATSSGTCALHAALTAIGVRPGDLVIAPSFTFIATANAIAACGAAPWLFDVSPADWCLDADLVARALERDTRRVGSAVYHGATGQRVAALMPTFTLGLVPDARTYRDLASRYGLPLMVDAAAAIGATHGGRPIAALADLAVLSFNGNKTVTSGGGGAVIGTDDELLARVRHLTTTARIDADYNYDAVGFNYRLTNVCAAVGCAQMERLDDFVAIKRRIRDAYRAGLSGIDGVTFYPEAAGGGNACWQSGVVLPEAGPSPREVVVRLANDGIEARPFWKPVHRQSPYAHALRTDMPCTDALWPRVLTLPCSTSLTPDDQATVIRSVRAALHA